ncbi:hypothetical protein AABB24_023457 [Solanum stoloniferum]|uniref:Uncharacterized protein n=1 Tax=Solanum stoloniferum TaxID=62892 RepID=A0ABD2SJJ2_9SOLN
MAGKTLSLMSLPSLTRAVLSKPLTSLSKTLPSASSMLMLNLLVLMASLLMESSSKSSPIVTPSIFPAYSKDPRQLHTPTMVTKGCLVQATGTLDVQELQLSTLCQPQLVHLRLWPLSFPASRVNSMALTYVSPLPMYRSWTLSFKYQRRHLQRKRMLHSGSLLTRSLLAFSPSAMSHLFHLTLDALIFHQLCIVHLPWSCEMTWLSLLLGMTMNGVSHREWLISLTLLPTNGYENAIIY